MNFEAQLQFKKDFGMTIQQAEEISRNRIKASDEIFSLKLYLNGLDAVTGENVNPSENERKEIEERIEKLYKVK